MHDRRRRCPSPPESVERGTDEKEIEIIRSALCEKRPLGDFGFLVLALG